MRGFLFFVNSLNSSRAKIITANTGNSMMKRNSNENLGNGLGSASV